jgi:hypothetical protein
VLTRNGIKNRIDYRKRLPRELRGRKIISNGSYVLTTGKYANFTEEYNRWYKNSIKVVPKDVNLDPGSIAQWYFGDGTGCGYKMSFYTDGFSVKDVCMLRDKLNSQYGLKLRQHYHCKKPILNVGKKVDRRKLTNLIRPFCPECFKYKLEVIT